MWTILRSGETHSLAEWGVGMVRRSWKNQVVDTLSFDVAGRSILDDPVFEGGSAIAVFHGDEKGFNGIITQTPVYGSAKLELHRYEASGAW
jgi:hypothetical protein